MRHSPQRGENREITLKEEPTFKKKRNERVRVKVKKGMEYGLEG